MADRPADSDPSAERIWQIVETAWLLAAAARVLARGDADQPADRLDEAARRLVAAAGLTLPPAEAGAMYARALRSQLAQMLAVSDPTTPVRWSDLDDATLLAQGRASGGNVGGALAPDGPAPAALRERLGAPGARFLDVGTGVGAICVALARQWPELHCVGLDVMPRALALAQAELSAAGVGDRVELRELDVVDLAGGEPAFDVAWLPLPLIGDERAAAALAAVVSTLRPHGWLVAAAEAPPRSELEAAATALRSAAVGGSAAVVDDVRQWFEAAGIVDVVEVPTRAGGAFLAGRRGG